MRPTGVKVVATNRQARRNYEILETIEAGIVLQGSEVKSLRESKVQLADSFARLQSGEAQLIALHIAPYLHAQDHSGHDPDRPRKLLMHKSEILRLQLKMDQERLSLVPLSLYFKEGRAKVELGLGKGRHTYDKRQVIAKRDAALDLQRAMRTANRGE
jgi:SsrA-binding protein